MSGGFRVSPEAQFQLEIARVVFKLSKYVLFDLKPTYPFLT